MTESNKERFPTIKVTVDELAELIRFSSESQEPITGPLGGYVDLNECGPLTIRKIARDERYQAMTESKSIPLESFLHRESIAAEEVGADEAAENFDNAALLIRKLTEALEGLIEYSEEIYGHDLCDCPHEPQNHGQICAMCTGSRSP